MSYHVIFFYYIFSFVIASTDAYDYTRTTSINVRYKLTPFLAALMTRFGQSSLSNSTTAFGFQ